MCAVYIYKTIAQIHTCTVAHIFICICIYTILYIVVYVLYLYYKMYGIYTVICISTRVRIYS